jgi:hypothetical protein
LIAHWCYENGKADQVIEIVERDSSKSMIMKNCINFVKGLLKMEKAILFKDNNPQSREN